MYVYYESLNLRNTAVLTLYMYCCKLIETIVTFVTFTALADCNTNDAPTLNIKLDEMILLFNHYLKQYNI